ncbi:MAG: putative DNA-binding domain-containing protein [Roseimicrobium sp.]
MSAPLPSMTQPYAETQRLMFAAVTRRLEDNGMQGTWTDGRPMADYAEQFIKPNDRLTSFDRLEIYNQQYWWRLLENFGADFRGLCAVIGQEKFDALAVAYLEHCGSTSWTLRDLGQHLEKFLLDHPGLTVPRTALALDIARLEWARAWAFDEPEDPPPDTQTLAQTPPEELRLRLQPYLVLLQLQHEADNLFLRFRQRDSSASESTASNAMNAAPRRRRELRITAKPAPAPVHLVVHRHRNTVFYKRVTPEAFALLTHLRQGATVDTACAEAFTGSAYSPEEAAGLIREWFAEWMELGWFAQ